MAAEGIWAALVRFERLRVCGSQVGRKQRLYGPLRSRSDESRRQSSHANRTRDRISRTRQKSLLLGRSHT